MYRQKTVHVLSHAVGGGVAHARTHVLGEQVLWGMLGWGRMSGTPWDHQ